MDEIYTKVDEENIKITKTYNVDEIINIPVLLQRKAEYQSFIDTIDKKLAKAEQTGIDISAQKAVDENN